VPDHAGVQGPRGPETAASARTRVLHLLAQDVVGGTELMVTMVAGRMQALGVPVEVATLSPPGPVSADLARHRIPVWSLGGKGLPVAALRFAGLLRARPYQVIQPYGFKASVIGRLIGRVWQPSAAIVCGVQGLHITEVVDLDELKGRFAIAVERRLTGLVDAYEVNSRGAIEFLARHGVEEARQTYIPNAIDTEKWSPASPPAGAAPLIVCAARFVERKRQEDLVDAVRILIARGVDCRLALVGDGPTRSSCEQRAQDIGISTHVEFPGVLRGPELAILLRSASVFALPSLWEGMPAAAMEAMACELPVVGTAVNGITDLVVDGVTGSLVSVRRPDQVATAIESLIKNPDGAREMGRAGRRHLIANHNLDKVVNAKLALYARVLDRKSARAYGLGWTLA
jgi:glycosyltransferase involved in cell wall biosynthesis